jgi:DNA-binding response OmpR family regulator
MKILVVDDEQDICEILQFNLETEGYEVCTANSAEEALELLTNSVKKSSSKDAAEPFSLVLLDVMMGGMSGFQLARMMKKDSGMAHIPIIFITALDNEDSTVKGLNIGADDYISKPLSLKEVKARVKAVLRRTQSHVMSASANEYKDVSDEVGYETLKLNLTSKQVTLDGELLQLTKLEFELLALLLQNIGKVFSRENLLKQCWPSDSYVLDRTVDVNITRLRKKIGVYGKHIKTRFGYGYIFEQ